MMFLRKKVLCRSIQNQFSSKSNKSINSTTKAIIERDSHNQLSQIHPWKEIRTKDGHVYFWNQQSNETTALGEPRPDPWVPVTMKTGHVYYHNLETNQTTALGTPLPSRYGSLQEYQPQQQQYQPVSLGRSMATYAILGVGMSMGIALVNSIFR